MLRNPFLYKDLNPLNRLDVFFELVHRVHEIPGITSDKPSIWNIEVCTENIKINTNEILSPKKFMAEFLKTFKCFPPRALQNKYQWARFVEFLGSKIEPCTDEESVEILTMNEVLSKIAYMNITSDRKKWLTGNYLLFHEGQLLLPSEKIIEFINVIGTKMDVGTLGKMMAERSIKAPGTKHISAMGQKRRAWWFQIDALNEYRDTMIDVSRCVSDGDAND